MWSRTDDLDDLMERAIKNDNDMADLRKSIEQLKRELIWKAVLLCIGFLGAAALLLGFLQYGMR